jgi:uncharacterized membrane protein
MAAASAQVYLDAVVEPPGSLSPRGFDRVMLALGCASFIMGCIFILVRAYPVAGFMGLEVWLLWALFRRSMHARSARTYLRVTAETVDLRKVDARGRERRARLPAPFARVEFDRRMPGPGALRLAHSGRRYAIGEHLTQRERESLANRLDKALADARRERHTHSRSGERSDVG